MWNEACFAHVVRDLPTGVSIAEYFGGVGIFTTILQHSLRPRVHHVFDLDPDCARQLEFAFKGHDGMHTGQADAKLAMGSILADIVVLDFPVGNVRFLERDWPIWRVFRGKPRFVIWSDTALRKIGFFRDLYSQFFGAPVHTYDDYIRCYNRWLWHRYRYTITRVARNYYAYYLAQPLRAMATPEVTAFTVAA